MSHALDDIASYRVGDDVVIRWAGVPVMGHVDAVTGSTLGCTLYRGGARWVEQVTPDRVDRLIR